MCVENKTNNGQRADRLSAYSVKPMALPGKQCKSWLTQIGFHAHSALVFAIAMLLCLYTSASFAEKVTLNFKGADIKAIITSVAEITGKSFIVDPRVKGKATIISTKPMNKTQVYQVFLSVLEVHGYSAVPSGRTIKIIPDADAKHSGMPTVTDEEPGKGDEAVTRVIQVEHVTAAQLVPILRPLIPPQGHLAAYPQSNVLIVSDRARNIERILSIIERIDQPSSGEIEIVQLQYAAAADLVRVLTSLQQQGAKSAAKTDRPTLVADERTNSILIGGDRSVRLQLRAIISHLDTPSEVEGDTHVVYLRYANAKDLVAVLTGVADTQKNVGVGGAKGKKGAPARARTVGGQGAGGMLNIQAEENSNALVITAPPGLFRSLEAVIRQLDVRRAQVQVEAIIAEVSSSTAEELGVQWLFNGIQDNKPIGGITFPGAPGIGLTDAAVPESSTDIGQNIAALGLASALGPGAAFAVGQFNSESFNFAALVTALKGDGQTNILSTPSLVTMDNEEAEIFVGNSVSIPSGSFTGTGSQSPQNPFTTFDRVPVGIRLKVKPQINEGDAIRMDIEQNVDAIVSGSAGASDVVTSERTITTSVLVDNGAILVLGGLIEENVVATQQAVPFLGEIPLLGALFRHTTTKNVKTNLMVFLRPLILRDENDSLTLTHSKYSYIRDWQQQMRDRDLPLIEDEGLPKLPEFDGQKTLPPPFKADEQTKSLIFDEDEMPKEIKEESTEEIGAPEIE